MRTVAILQPSYIPWKGYFDIIDRADVFIFLEDVQYTVQDWRSRNRIKLKTGGSAWLSVPVAGTIHQLICEARIDSRKPWRKKHLRSIEQNYSKAPYFRKYFPGLCDVYEQHKEFLADLDIALTKQICRWLGISSEFLSSTEFDTSAEPTTRLIDLVQAVGGDHYLSGPAARDYLDEAAFEKSGISLEYVSYAGYPPYPQISEPFEHQVSVLDLLFMTGPGAMGYIRRTQEHSGD